MGDPELIDWLNWQRTGPDTAALVAVVDPCLLSLKVRSCPSYDPADRIQSRSSCQIVISKMVFIQRMVYLYRAAEVGVGCVL